MKVCSKCKVELPLENFHRRAQGYQTWCKPCRKAHDRVYFQETREVRIEQKKKLQQGYAEEFKAYKETLSCVFCGENESVCLDFHHIDGTKEYAVSNGVYSRPLSSLMVEINKCIVLCANCHRKVHAKIIRA